MKKIGRCWLLCIFICLGPSSENVGTSNNPIYVKPKILPPEDMFTPYVSLAIAMQQKYNIPASIILAQCLQESGLGVSKLARQTNNHFGIKCKASCRRPGHCKNKEDDYESDRFFVYPNAEASFEHHAKVLSRGRYVRFRFDFGLDWEKWCDGLQKKGYATDNSYARCLKHIIKKYKLYGYDKDASEQSFGPETWIAGLDRRGTGIRP